MSNKLHDAYLDDHIFVELAEDTVRLYTNGVLGTYCCFNLSPRAQARLVEFLSATSKIRAKPHPDALSFSIDDLELSVRFSNCLKAAGIKTVGALVAKSHNELSRKRGFGVRCLREIVDALRDMGLRLREEDE